VQQEEEQRCQGKGRSACHAGKLRFRHERCKPNSSGPVRGRTGKHDEAPVGASSLGVTASASSAVIALRGRDKALRSYRLHGTGDTSRLTSRGRHGVSVVAGARGVDRRGDLDLPTGFPSPRNLVRFRRTPPLLVAPLTPLQCRCQTGRLQATLIHRHNQLQ
jgi:hypothetical protein